jgi:transposase
VKRRVFDQDFKRRAVDQVVERGRSAADVARELGIRADQVRRWKQLLRGGTARRPPTPRLEELAHIRREIGALRRELALLERAAAILATGAAHHGRS